MTTETMIPRKPVLTGRYMLQRIFNVPRIIVEEIRLAGEDLYFVIQYRLSRIFARFDTRLRLKFQVNENDLVDSRADDYRCFTVDDRGRMIIAFSRNDAVNLIALDETGNSEHLPALPAVPLLESIVVDEEDACIVHSPAPEAPLVRVKPGNKTPVLIGKYPPGPSSIVRRFGRILKNQQGDLSVIYENRPAYLQRYDRNGVLLCEKNLDENRDDVIRDLQTTVLDISAIPGTGNLCVLRNTPPQASRIAEIIDNRGNLIKSVLLPPETRRIAVGASGVLYAARTEFSIRAMISTRKLYGSIAYLDTYTLE